MCSYTTYTAGVMTAYIAAQKALQGMPLVGDMELLNKCIRVLAYCSKKDALAGKFHDVLIAHLSTLEQHETSTNNLIDASPTTQSPTVEVLFTRSAGTSKLHSASRDLLRLTHRPFSGLPNISAKETLSNTGETNLGIHLEWEWELKDRDRANGVAERAESSCGISTEAEVERPEKSVRLQPRGGPFTIWTPPQWDTAFTS